MDGFGGFWKIGSEIFEARRVEGRGDFDLGYLGLAVKRDGGFTRIMLFYFYRDFRRSWNP